MSLVSQNAFRTLLTCAAFSVLLVKTASGDTDCASCGALPACSQWGLAKTTPKWCGSTDHTIPQACTDYLKQEFNCIGGGTGYKLTSEYHLGYTCTNDSCF